jgi:ATP-dependent DNA helicase DinG
MSQLIEVKVHHALRDLLRQQRELANWPHHLTMARLVARTLRLSKSALIQTGLPTQRREGKYRLSYLISALLWEGGVAIVVPTALHQQLIGMEIPQLQEWLGTHKSIYFHDRAPSGTDFQGLWLVSPQAWLSAQLQLDPHLPLPPQIPTIIDGADELATWAQELLTITLTPSDWDSLRQHQPSPIEEMITHTKIDLTQHLWQRPSNPHNCYVLDSPEQDLIRDLDPGLTANPPSIWQQFQARLSSREPHVVWATLNRPQGNFQLSIAPIDILSRLTPIWGRQPLVLVTGFVDLSSSGSVYGQQLGLGEITAVKFSLDRQTELFQLYIPRWMPMPNTSNFQTVLVTEIQRLLHLRSPQPRFVVILVQDTPLQGQLATILAAEWGTKVQVEKLDVDATNILVTGWEFWDRYQDDLPIPQLMIIPTLPIPSLEDPLVAAKVSFYKQTKQDWFRLYLLPTGLRILQRAIAPVRSCQGVVAIFDNRIDRRSYGQQVLAALSPMARIDYPDSIWLSKNIGEI